jgi:hypothetical protein
MTEVTFRCLHCGNRVSKELSGQEEEHRTSRLWLWIDCGCGMQTVITADGEIKDLPLKWRVGRR